MEKCNIFIINLSLLCLLQPHCPRPRMSSSVIFNNSTTLIHSPALSIWWHSALTKKHILQRDTSSFLVNEKYGTLLSHFSKNFLEIQSLSTATFYLLSVSASIPLEKKENSPKSIERKNLVLLQNPPHSNIIICCCSQLQPRCSIKPSTLINQYLQINLKKSGHRRKTAAATQEGSSFKRRASFIYKEKGM